MIIRIILLLSLYAWAATTSPSAPEASPSPSAHQAALDSIHGILEEALQLVDDEHFDSAVTAARRALSVAETDGTMPDSIIAVLYNTLGHCQYGKRAFAAAESLWTQAKAIRERMPTPPDSLLADIIINFGRLRFSQRQLPQAESLLVRGIEILEGLYGPENIDVVNIYPALATVRAALGRLDEGEAMHRKTLRIRQKMYGENHLDVAKSYRDLALFCSELGRYPEADSLHRLELDIRRNLLGPDHMLVAESMASLAVNAYETGRYAEADSLYPSVLDIQRRSVGDDHPSVVRTITNIANVQLALGNYPKAEEMYKRAIEGVAKIYGTEHQEYERTIANLAAVYHNTAAYDKAESLYTEALGISEKIQGRDGPDYAFVEANLAAINIERGQYTAAEDRLRHATEVFEKTFGFRHPYVASNLYNLSFLCRMLGRYYEAIELLKQGIDISKGLMGAEYPTAANDLSQLASIYDDMGRKDEAKELYRQTLEIRERKFGPEHFEVAQTLANLGGIADDEGNIDEAEQLHRRALAIREKVFGMENRYTAQSLGHLAHIYYEKGRYAEAESLFTQTLGVFRQVLEPIHLDPATAMDGLAMCYAAQGKYDQAELLYLEAFRIREAIYGPRQPNVAVNLEHLARSYASSGDLASSLAFYRRFLSLRQQFIEYAFSFSSEEQKLRWVREYPLSAPTLPSLALTHPTDETARLAFEMTLNAKALVLDAVMAEQQAAYCGYDPSVRNKLARRTEVCSAIASLFFSESETAKARDSLQRLYAAQDSLETELSRICSPFRDDLLSRRFKAADVAAALPDKTVLLEYIKYTPYDFGKIARENDKTGPDRYLVFALEPGGAITLFDLGEARVIDSLINTARELIYQSSSRIYSAMATDFERRLMAVTTPLYERLFALPIKHLSDVTDIFVSPDGEINLLPFEILADPSGAYVIEKYQISYLSSGRDLLKPADHAVVQGDAMIMADPDFNLAASQPPAAEAKAKSKAAASTGLSLLEPVRGTAECLRQDFLPLAFGRKETAAIAQTIKATTGLDIHEYYQADASEETIKNLSTAPKILHIITHGFFCPPSDTSTGDVMSNPLIRSGLALAGANRVIRGRDSADVGGEDGILTAFEASGLNLIGTELATLSACETGLGETLTGEGVFGLRRAFRHAGAQTILMSLWNIPDKETFELMEGFYQRWLGGMSKGDALRESSLEVLRRCRKDYGHGHPLLWGGFVLAGNPL